MSYAAVRQLALVEVTVSAATWDSGKASALDLRSLLPLSSCAALSESLGLSETQSPSFVQGEHAFLPLKTAEGLWELREVNLSSWNTRGTLGDSFAAGVLWTGCLREQGTRPSVLLQGVSELRPGFGWESSFLFFFITISFR